MADDDRYTDPALRERLKDEIQAGGKGGKPGQWSARKAQMLVQAYEREGGGYRGGKDESQRHLERWGDEDWGTKEGSASARSGSKEARYLPAVAWELLSPKEREGTDRPKRSSDEQFVANTDAAKEARAAAQLLSTTAGEAAKAVRRMETKSALRCAERAETNHGSSRKTVLDAIAKRRSKL